MHMCDKLFSVLVIKPFIDNITDPDFFNRHVILYIEAQENDSRTHLKSIENAKSFEDVMKIIHSTDDIEALKSLRYCSFKKGKLIFKVKLSGIT